MRIMATGNITGIIYLSPAFLECLELGVVFFVCLFWFCFVFSLGPHLWHMKVPRLGVKLEV